MKKILYAALGTLLVAGAASAATIQGNQIRMCDQTLDISPELQPSTLISATAMYYEAKRFDLVYESFAQHFENSLEAAEKLDPAIKTFIATIRGAHEKKPGYFGITPDVGNSENLFESGPDQISFNCTTRLAPYQANMAAVALITRWMRNMEMTPAIRERALFVSRQSKVHEALLNNGLPMWPWELWLNGKRLGSSDQEPLFKTQWVVMRPTAGIEINTRNRASGNLDASVAMEPLGFVHYQNDDYKTWWGASLLVTSSTNAGIGLGGLLRWNNYVLGATRHESNTVGIPASNFLFIGIELYDLINKQRGDMVEWRQLQTDRLQQILNSQPNQ